MTLSPVQPHSQASSKPKKKIEPTPLPELTPVEQKIFYSAESTEAAWALRSRRDIVDFIKYMTGLSKPPAKHHIMWLMHMIDPEIDRLNLIAPRESAKTTISEYFLAWYIGNFPYRTNYIVSANLEQAKARLNNIRNIIQSDRYKNVFPHISLDPKKPNKETEFSIWSSKYKTTENITYNNWVNILQSKHDAKDATLFAVGVGGNVVGRRCSGVCLLDDLHNAKNAATELQRQKVINSYSSEIEPTVTETGKVISISTRWAETDFPGYLKTLKTDEGKSIWKTIDIPAINSKGESYWAEFWSIPKLMRKREKVQPIWFECMYMNNPFALSSNLFTIDQLRQDLPNPLPSFSSIIISTDLATSESTRADYTVLTAIARDNAMPFNMYILAMRRGRWSITKTHQKIPEFYQFVVDNFGRCNKILYEKQGMQPALIQTLALNHPYLPFFGVSLKNKNKTARMEGVALKAQHKMLYINQDMNDYPAMVSELLGWGNTNSHDDIGDSISLPLQWGEWLPNMSFKSEYSRIKVATL